MKSIYRGEKVENVGSFIFFMQSPAGIMCIMLVVVAFIAMPIVDGMFAKKEIARVKVLIEKNRLPVNALDVYSKKKKKKKTKKAKEVKEND